MKKMRSNIESQIFLKGKNSLNLLDQMFKKVNMNSNLVSLSILISHQAKRKSECEISQKIPDLIKSIISSKNCFKTMIKTLEKGKRTFESERKVLNLNSGRRLAFYGNRKNASKWAKRHAHPIPQSVDSIQSNRDHQAAIPVRNRSRIFGYRGNRNIGYRNRSHGFGGRNNRFQNRSSHRGMYRNNGFRNRGYGHGRSGHYGFNRW